MIAGDKADSGCKLRIQCFIREQMFLQFRHLKNHINLEKQKQEQDTDMNVIDTDCSGSGADASSYFCSGGHRRIFLVLPPPSFFFQNSITSCVQATKIAHL